MFACASDLSRPSCSTDCLASRSRRTSVLFTLLFLFFALAIRSVAQSPSGNVVVSTNTTWAQGNYQVSSLTINSGATLTVGGGSMVSVTGAIVVTANSNLVLQAINNTAQVNGTWQGAGVSINAASVEVDAGSSINADGQGYVASAGPGGAPAGSFDGGSYGGLGAVQEYPIALPLPVYGNATAPTDLGSGGDLESNSTGAAGGGAVHLIVSGTLTVNGIISANGVPPSTTGGSGAGGSVYLQASELAGAGSITANGGSGQQNGAYGGGGGRVAVYYNSTNSSFTGFASSTASGGNGSFSPGATGTAAFFDTSTTDRGLSVYQDFVIPSGTSVSYNSVTVQSGALLTVGGGSTITVDTALHVTGTLVAQATNNSVQVNGKWQGAGVTLNAASIEVDAGSSINADGQGYVPAAGPGGAPFGTNPGASYGGVGGVVNGYVSPSSYGSVTAPIDLGSGGSSTNGTVNGSYGGAGGGAVRLIVTGTLTNNGLISANGQTENGENTLASGGSGGSVFIQTATLAGTGSIQANGGGAFYPGGGGGGRAAVYYTTNSGFNLDLVTANGGGGGANGSPGTVYTLGANTNLTVSDNVALPANSNLSYSTITVNNAGSLTLGSGTTLTAESITVSTGSTVNIGGGSNVTVSGVLAVTGNSNVVLQGTNTTAQINGAWEGAGVTLNAASIEVDAGSSINADGQGYVPAAGPGGAPFGTNPGASYGGVGGAVNGYVSPPSYGSVTAPIDLGSGGSSTNGTVNGSYGGAGGGAVRLIVTGTLTNNGLISANGQTENGENTLASGGSGGSVFIQTATLAGTGSIQANGGGAFYPGGGGGGRAAVYYTTNSGFEATQVTANGGSGGANGATGSVVFTSTPTFALFAPMGSVLHGTKTLQWFGGAVDLTNTTVKLVASGPDVETLGSGLGANSSLSLDTTTLANGKYEFRLTFYDANGNDMQEVPRTFVINNSLAWHVGILTSSQEWTASQVQGIDGAVIIPSGVTVTIDPGTIVKAAPGAQIIVQPGGILNALGTASGPIIFTTFDDSSVGGDTAFNGGVTVPTVGEWNGVTVQTGGQFNTSSYTDLLYLESSLSGTLPASQTLQSTEVYQVSGTLIVPTGTTLTIQPGTIIKFAANAGISVLSGGALVAQGTIAQPIYFTSINDSSVGGNTSGSAQAPAPGDWGTILIDGATATFNYVHMLYGGGPANSQNLIGMVQTGDNATVTITNSVLGNSFYNGILTGNPSGGDTVTLSNSVITGAEDRGIDAFPGSTVNVTKDTFDANSSGMEVHGGTVNVVNTIISNSTSTQFGGVDVCCGGALNISYSDVFTTAAGVANYNGVADPTGSNGNISTNPVYVNAALGDYRLNFGSPAIDAANGKVSPLTDAMGDPRYNDPRVATKTGVPNAAGKYPDMGAFEYVESAPSDIDLTVPSVNGPATAVVGSKVQITWTDTNTGAGAAQGPWHDAIYLVQNPDTNPVALFAGEVLVANGATLGSGASVTSTGTVAVPGVPVGNYRWEVKANDRGEVFVGQNSANAIGLSLDPVAIDMPRLTVDAAATLGSLAATGQSAWYKLAPGVGKTILVNLNLTGGASTGAVQLFIGQGYVPTPQHYDYQQSQFNSTTASVVIPNTSSETYYVTAYAQQLTSSPAPFSLSASTVKFSLTSVQPNSVPNAGSATLTFVGGGFTSAGSYQIVDSSGTVYNSASVFITDSAHAAVTFAMTGLPTGTYGAQVVESGSTVSLNNALTVTSAGSTGSGGTSTSPGGQIQVDVVAPTAFRAGFPAEVTLNYTNVSGSDLPAPMILVSVTGASLSKIAPPCSGCNTNFPLMYQNASTSFLVLGISNQGPAGVLPAGASGSAAFLGTSLGGTVTFTTQVVSTAIPDPLIGYTVAAPVCPPLGCPVAGIVKSNALPRGSGASANAQDTQTASVGDFTDATAFCSTFLPPFYNAAGFSRTCMQLLVRSRYEASPITTVAPYEYLNLDGRNINGLLASDATVLSGNGVYESDGNSVIGFELQNDGLNLFNQRYHQGAFGFGTSHGFDITAEVYNGSPVIHYPDGSSRTFPVVNPAQANQYLGNPGDYGLLTVNSDGTWTITESDGTLSHFLLDIQANSTNRQLLDYIQDLNGNRITLTYTNDLVTSVVDNFGNTITFAYDSLGHIVKATDPVGRVTTYTYDIKNDSLNSTFLTSVTDVSGTTSFTWNEGGASGVGYFADACVSTYCEPAIGVNTIAYPDGTHTYLTYDSLGRIATSSGDGMAGKLTYTYGSANAVSITDADGDTRQLASDQNGNAVQYTDPLGSVTQLSYDPESKLTGVRGPLGANYQTGYDTQGNVASLLDPLANLQSYSSTVHNRIQSFTSPSGNASTFAYDNNYNLASETYSDGSATSLTHDSHGNVTSVTNRRGHTITYAYNSVNLLTSKTYADGTQVSYTYDGHRNLLTSTASNGTTTFSYDAADRLTGVTYPKSQSITYTYNSGGQRTRMSDSTGFAVNYTYDAAGRLSTLSNGSGSTIVSYTYDAAGRLTAKQLGNGTATTYTYDANGNPLHLVNKTSGGALLSEFDYTYDALDRRATMAAPSGDWAYGYDPDGEVSSVTLPGSNILYTYDADGNRVTGSGVNYNVNNLDQYTATGTSAYSYDADGNLLSGGGWTYTYDDENRLAGMSNATDTWTYQYDGLGSRVSATHNGTVTQYLNDLSGLGNVEAEFNGSGQVVSHYTYGLDLTSSVPASGSAAYYHFDATGNTAQMTNASGAVVNSYTYLPFGEKLASTAGVANPFTYVGEYGVMDEGSGLYYMRNRFYSPTLGRFVQQDPTGLASDTNLYRYSANNPLSYVDPDGTNFTDCVDSFTNSDASHFINGLSPFLKNGPASDRISTLSLTLTSASFARNYQDGNTADTIHDGALIVTSFLSKLPDTGPTAPLVLVSKYAGTIDEVSQTVFKAYFDYKYGPSDPPPTPSNPCSNPPKSTPPAFSQPGPNVPILPLFNKQPMNSNTVPSGSSKDPNGKLTSGFGDQGFVPSNTPILYTIYFENQSTATAPAEQVVVKDPLAANLDWSTVQLNQIQFNGVTINVPAGQQSYVGQVKVSTDPNPVSVNASINPSTGVLAWTMQSINPATGGLPADPLAGFLPPNNAANQGTGYVTFSVKPKSGLANGTAITNQASIVFDVNASISTNTVTNTIDSVDPVSSVGALPATTSAASFPVTWSGTDPAGAGIASYTLYVSVDGQPYSIWLGATTATSGTYTGAAGNTYSFYSIATDNVGNIQKSPGPIQTTTVGQSAATQSISFGALAAQTYGASPITLTATASSGLPVAYAVTGPATLSGSALSITGAGQVSVTATQSGNANFAAATPVTQSFNVSKAILTVTAANLSRAFEAANPALAYAVTGFVKGDTTSVVTGTATLTTTATASSPVGTTYPITFSTENLAATNYSFTYVPGTLTISGQKAQTITFNPLPNQTYGTPSIVLTATASSGLPVLYTVTGPATLSGSTLSITGAGQVSVTATQGGNANFAAATPVTQSFNVSKAILTVTVANVSRAFGSANPALTYAVAGFVKGDTILVVTGTATLTTTATTTSPMGTYPITFSTEALTATNYTFNYVSGTLTVQPPVGAFRTPVQPCRWQLRFFADVDDL